MKITPGYNGRIKKMLICSGVFLLAFLAIGCAEQNNMDQISIDNQSENRQFQDDGEKMTDIKIKITVEGQELTATLDNNPTTQALIEKLPMTVPMVDLFNREMAYRFSEELPTDNVATTGYEVGEIIYWPPGRAFVILYAQNGERFSMQKIGRIDSGVEIFDGLGDVEVTFELMEDFKSKLIRTNGFNRGEYWFAFIGYEC